MAELSVPEDKEITEAAEVYIKAFISDPWYEDNSQEEVERYFKAFTSSDTKKIFILREVNKVIGVALCIVVPCIPNPFLRIEDFCINPDYIHKGYGSTFLNLITEEAKKIDCDSILLATVRDFPSHKFYNKNGFTELENSVYLYKEF